MRVACVGAGPAGLYAAILLKRMDPGNDVVVFEENRSGIAQGWGVVFWSDLLQDLLRSDAESGETILKESYRWTDQVLDLSGRPQVRAASGGFSIRRHRLIQILADRAVALGVTVQFETEIVDLARLHDMDLVVAADGAGSRIRRLHRERHKTTFSTGRNLYVWLGALKVFDAFTFGFAETEYGWIWFHAYGCDAETSTFIVECSPETWVGLGFDKLSAKETLTSLENIFERQLEGKRLQSQRPDLPNLHWLHFRTLESEHWHAGNVVLVGDAAHTTHFSIGSGTRLAIQDAISLAAHLRGAADLQTKLQAYQADRQRALRPLQRDAELSARWFENVERYLGQNAAHAFTLLRRRRSRWLPHMPPRLFLHLSNAASAARRQLLRKIRSMKASPSLEPLRPPEQ